MKIEFFPRRQKPKLTFEEKIASGMVVLAANSYIVMGLLFSAIFGTAQIAVEPSRITDPFFTKVFAISILYIVSLFLLGSLPGKSYERRRLSWTYSIIFHAGLLTYLGVVESFGTFVLVIGMVELVALGLSIIGLSVLLHGKYKAHREIGLR